MDIDMARVESKVDIDFPAKAAVLAAVARTAAEAEEKVLDLRRQLASAKEIVRAERDEENEFLRQRIADLGMELEREREAFRALRDSTQQDRERAVHFETVAESFRKSTSWRITAPLRAVVLMIRGWR